jgi:uncharacterized membrane protein
MVKSLLHRPYLLAGIAAGLALYLLGIPLVPRRITRVLIAWDGGLAMYLCLSLLFMRDASVARMRQRAVLHKVGDRLVLLAAILASVASIGALVTELSTDKGYPPRLFLAAGTVVLSWLFVQIVFAMHYAHRYYLPDEKGRSRRGLAFGGESDPDYWDFVHFSIVIGATSQTADIAFTSRPMRRIGTLHTLVAFAFNTAILATMINLAANIIF